MTSFGHILDLLDSRYANIQDVSGNIAPFPTLVPYDQYGHTPIVYHMDTIHEIFLGMLQQHTHYHSMETLQEVWTWWVQWQVETSSSVPAAPSAKKQRLDSTSAKSTKDKPVYTVDRRVLRQAIFENDEMHRILVDIVTADSTILPNYVEFLYQWIDYYEGDGKALNAAVRQEIPSLWLFQEHPRAIPRDKDKNGLQESVDTMKKERTKPDIFAFEKRAEESERMQYHEVKFGLQRPIDPDDEPLTMLINIPKDWNQRVRYYAACFKNRQRAFWLLQQVGISGAQIQAYKKGQPEPVLETPEESGSGPGFRYYYNELPHANNHGKIRENMMKAREKQREISLSNRLAEEARLAAQDATASSSPEPPVTAYTQPILPRSQYQLVRKEATWKEREATVFAQIPKSAIGKVKSRLFALSNPILRDQSPTPPPRDEFGNPYDDDDDDEDEDNGDDEDNDSGDSDAAEDGESDGYGGYDNGDDDGDDDGDDGNQMDTTGISHFLMPPVPGVAPGPFHQSIFGPSPPGPPPPPSTSEASAGAQQPAPIHPVLLNPFASSFIPLDNPFSPSYSEFDLPMNSPSLGTANSSSINTPSGSPSTNLFPYSYGGFNPPANSPFQMNNSAGQFPSSAPANNPFANMVHPAPPGGSPLQTTQPNDSDSHSVQSPASSIVLSPGVNVFQLAAANNASNTSQQNAFNNSVYPSQQATPNFGYGYAQHHTNVGVGSFQQSTSNAGVDSFQNNTPSTAYSPFQQTAPNTLPHPPGPVQPNPFQQAGPGTSAQPLGYGLSANFPNTLGSQNTAQYNLFQSEGSSSAAPPPGHGPAGFSATTFHQSTVRAPPPAPLDPRSFFASHTNGPPNVRITASSPSAVTPLANLAGGMTLASPLPSANSAGSSSNAQPPPADAAASSSNARRPPTKSAGNTSKAAPKADEKPEIPICIYFPNIVLSRDSSLAAVPSDCMLLGYTRPGSRRFALSSAVFLPTHVWENIVKRNYSGGWCVLESYLPPRDHPANSSQHRHFNFNFGPPKNPDEIRGIHRELYGKVLQAYNLMTECADREAELTKRWRVTPGPMTKRNRGSIWEGWAMYVDRPIEVVEAERKQAIVLKRIDPRNLDDPEEAYQAMRDREVAEMIEEDERMNEEEQERERMARQQA